MAVATKEKMMMMMTMKRIEITCRPLNRPTISHASHLPSMEARGIFLI
ncbi:hypothetical protein PC116_g32449 [Phytophthora cactorum]|nr:hypothetical protein PC116_g32449 [Phytophthora cactorum]